jgi:spoIIIJ-associated protein
MQKATPPGGSSQQQALLKIMPIMFGVFGIFFPAGLVLYWTTSNGWQIGQQYFMLKSRPTAEQLAESAKSKPQKAEKKGFMSSMMERAEQQRELRGTSKPGTKKPGTTKPPASKGGSNGTTGSGPTKPGSKPGPTRRDQGPEATAVEEIRRSAPSVEEALEAALGELGLTEQEADVQVIQEPRSGVFGVGAQEAIVVVRSRVKPDGELSEDDLDEQAEIAAEFLEGMLERMGITATVESAFEDGTMYVDVIGPEPDDEDMGLLIGRHGQTLEAIQELTRVAIGLRTGLPARVVVDIEDYRKRQIDRLTARVREIAARVAKTGRSETLEPMNPFLRKMVHTAVAEVDGVESSSEGEGAERRVVIQRAR